MLNLMVLDNQQGGHLLIERLNAALKKESSLSWGRLTDIVTKSEN
jgi:hypothetical protein